MKLGILGNICSKLHTEIGTWQFVTLRLITLGTHFSSTFLAIGNMYKTLF